MNEVSIEPARSQIEVRYFTGRSLQPLLNVRLCVTTCRFEKIDKETNKQVYCQLLSRCCKELTSAQVNTLPAHLRAVIEPKFEAYQEKKRM